MPDAAQDWHEFATRDELAKALAGAVAGVLGEAIAKRGSALLAVSGGTTPALFLRSLSDADIDWQRVTVTLVDERLVPEDSPRSNAGLVMANLMRNKAAAANFVGLYSQAATVEGAAMLASDRIGSLALPLDAVILGMGGDGHTASFFPDAITLDALLDPASTEIVAPVHADSAGEPRLTLTLARIVEAGFIALHIEGAEKRSAFDTAFAAQTALPVRVVFERAKRPVQVFWAP